MTRKSGRGVAGGGDVVVTSFYNLEAIPAKQNLAKSAKIGQRELDLARRWRKAGLLSAAGLAAVEAAAKAAQFAD